MKRIIVFQAMLITILINASPVFAQTADVDKIQTFIQNLIQILVTLAGLISAVFFVLGGIKYITSSGNPNSMEGAKKTILYSALGLAIVLGAFVITNIVTQLATTAFGK